MGEIFYSQYDLPNGQYNIGYASKSTKNVIKDDNINSDIDIQIEKLNFGLYTTINVKLNDNTNEGIMYYGLNENR